MAEKFPSVWKLSNTPVNNPCIKMRCPRKNEIYSELNEIEKIISKLLEFCLTCLER